MAASEVQPKHDIERVVRQALGDGAVSKVSWSEHLNRDGLPVLRVRVVYKAVEAPTLDQMAGVVDALLDYDRGIEAPFPVVDFRADTDNDPIAAE